MSASDRSDLQGPDQQDGDALSKNAFLSALEEHKVHYQRMSDNFSRKFAAMAHEVKLSRSSLKKCEVSA